MYIWQLPLWPEFRASIELLLHATYNGRQSGLAAATRNSRMLQKYNGLVTDNLAGANHLQCLAQRQFQHFDILAFILKPIALAGFQAVVAIGDEEVELLRN